MQLNFVAIHNKKSKLIGEGIMNQSPVVNRSVRLPLVEQKSEASPQSKQHYTGFKPYFTQKETS